MPEPAVAPATATAVGGSKAPLTLRSEWVLRTTPGLDGTSKLAVDGITLAPRTTPAVSSRQPAMSQISGRYRYHQHNDIVVTCRYPHSNR